ncbi:hypothetical protein GBN24_01915 [Plesiomonas shigelloides]|uniref:hypothetical protein n=1 Tax=Plesiomonas shigelloides TaxID=703 RepID=UPI0012614C8B|nr:hypothetical protein [Plesiomonas shigelloides]KAB7694185.1 hypothetical protein GBN24_01915 [Plesiomonas shigelloides]
MQFLDSLTFLDSQPCHDADAYHVFYRATFLSAVATRLITCTKAISSKTPLSPVVSLIVSWLSIAALIDRLDDGVF